jgi:hypothetical protein
MKRDIDLCRQILLDLEAKAHNCTTNLLRGDLAHSGDERVRNHVRLLIDAGLVAEVPRPTTNTICVRLTHAGHEFIELSRGDGRWNDAKQVVLNRTGGLSLTVIKAVLTKWAVEGVATPRRVRRVVRPADYRYGSRYVADNYRGEEVSDPVVDDSFTIVRTRPDYRERFDWRESVADLGGYGYTTEAVESPVEVTLPIYMV